MKRMIGLVGGVALTLSAASAQAQSWPTRTVKLIVPFAAGGAADVVTRIVAAKVQENLGQTFIIENKTGASGKIGMEAAAKSPPDGYTYVIGSPGTLAINPNVFATLPYDFDRDFVAVSHAATFPQVLAVNASLPVKTLKDFIAYVQPKPNALNYGSSGTGSTGHLITASFLHETKLVANHIPYRGGGPAAQALAAGNVEFVIDGLPTFQGLEQSNLLRIIAITSAKRWPGLDVPSISEDAVPGFDLSSWVVFAAPKGTSKEIVDKLSAEIAKAVAAKDVQDRLAKVGAFSNGTSPADADKFVKAELAKWKKITDVTGTKLSD